MFRLPDGKSIQMVSALILQLVQSCTAGHGEHKKRSVGEEGEGVLLSEIDRTSNDFKKVE